MNLVGVHRYMKGAVSNAASGMFMPPYNIFKSKVQTLNRLAEYSWGWSPARRPSSVLRQLRCLTHRVRRHGKVEHSAQIGWATLDAVDVLTHVSRVASPKVLLLSKPLY